MDLGQFRNSPEQPAPSAGPAPLQSLWWSAKGDWERAHKIVQDIESTDAAWVHAYLHRVEGDLSNARYWYGQAGRTAATVALEVEWDAIAAALLGKMS